MIKLNRNSWHMKFYMSMNDYPPENLCEWGRKFLLAIFLWIVLITIASGVLFFATYPLGYAVNYYDNGLLFSTGVILDGGLAIMFARSWAETHRGNNLLLTDLNPDLPDTGFIRLLGHYWDAVHKKICPLITVE